MRRILRRAVNGARARLRLRKQFRELGPLQLETLSSTPGRTRVLILMHSYPAYSETYMHEEIRSLSRDFNLRLVSLTRTPQPRRVAFEHRVVWYPGSLVGSSPVYSELARINLSLDRWWQRWFLRRLDKVIEEFEPDVLHGHYLGLGLILQALSARHQIPFTLRTHSMDTLSEPSDKLQVLCRALNSDWCRGVIAFPGSRERLVAAGLSPEKSRHCWPVVAFGRFHRPEARERQGRVLCVGPAGRKKGHSDFVTLASKMRGQSDLTFHLYGSGGSSLDETLTHSRRLGDVIEIHYADPDDMHEVYPRHDWLVYPADLKIQKVGLPVAIAEAQAAGLGVCWQELPGRRDEQLAYLGGGGFLFKSINEVPAIIVQPYPESMRQAGFRAARRCDIERHRHLCADEWKRSCPGTSGGRRSGEVTDPSFVRVARVLVARRRVKAHFQRLGPPQEESLAYVEGRPGVLLLMHGYPVYSATYMHEEVRSLSRDFNLSIVALSKALEPRRRVFAHRVIPYPGPLCGAHPVRARLRQLNPDLDRRWRLQFVQRMDSLIREIEPDVLHGHYLGLALILRDLARRHRIPFTLRTHSVDELAESPQKLQDLCEALNSVWCRRVLAFPAAQERLIGAGVAPEKVVSCWPLVAFESFHRPAGRKRQGRVLCAGPATRKKARHQFVDLASSMRGSSDLAFHLYASGTSLEETRTRNRRAGGIVDIRYADPEDMPEVYPRYDWLVYPSDTRINRVGLPVAIAEAQAAGLGVCWQELPGRREEQLAYLGGGGFLFKSIDDVPTLLAQPYPEVMRTAGFRAAQRCDIEQHRHLCADIWNEAAAVSSTAASR